MRHTLMLATTLGFLSAACGTTNPPPTSTGATTTGGAGSGTTGGQSNLLPGAACTSNKMCETGKCGVDGTGNCCDSACTVDSGVCAAAGCDDAGACIYPGNAVLCGSVAASCTNGTAQLPSACNGGGACDEGPGTQVCSPFLCGPTACLASCTDGSSCVSGGYCDVGDATCCPGLGKFGKLWVDSVYGKDAPCCGIGSERPCQTLTQAMKVIDVAQAQEVSIRATVKDGGGDWTPAGEKYPIVLGWGAEVIGAGVYFNDPNGSAEIFQVGPYSASDTVGLASIAGIPTSDIGVGMNLDGGQSTDASAIQVQSGTTLYLANASVNGSATAKTTAITVGAGGKLVLGQDRSGGLSGVVTVGNSLGATATDGWNGIVCQTDGGAGCTISDSPADQSGGVVIVGQENLDLDAEDNAAITLSAAPVIGVAPSVPGFKKCPSKVDASASSAQAVLLHGKASVSISDGMVQCVAGKGFELEASANGTPNLTLVSTTIQNTDNAIHASAGKATVSNSIIRFNYLGAFQDSDGTNTGIVDLSGGNLFGTNTVVCSSMEELSKGTASGPGVCVLNATSTVLDADSVIWDTPGPDLYSCTPAPPTCTGYTCQIASCTNGSTDGIDALYESSGTITTNENQLFGGHCSGP